jgi:septation ring formation regulator EzrA
VNETIDEMYQAQQPMRDYLETLQDYRDRLAENIEEVNNTFFEGENPEQALQEFQDLHDEIGMLTGEVDLNITTVVPTQTSQIPGVDYLLYLDHEATFTLMPPSP